jgi:hypothetical protein
VDWEAERDEAAARNDLASLLAREGRLDELRTRADVGDQHASARLADLLAAQGRLDELRKRANQRNGYAIFRLAELAADEGHFDDARTIMRPWAYDGNEAAVIFMLDMKARQNVSDSNYQA